MKEGQEDRLTFYAGVVVLIGAVGLVGAAVLAKESASRLGAFFGVAASLFAGLVALSLKRWALTRSLQWALGMMGVSFGVRLVLVLVGMWVAHWRAASVMAYVIGFFGVYFPLQWVEVSYVLDESKRRHGG